MPSEYRYHIDPKADRKLAAHLEFLARVSESAALRLYDEYKGAIEFIGNSAQSCPRYYSRKLPEIELKYWLFGNMRYRIVFEIIGADIFAYDIQDCRQNPDGNIA